jgi:hypothetical protein
MLSEPLLVVARIVQAFDELGIQYLVGGSLASSVYGVPRATQGVDLVADLKLSDADRLQQLLSGEFYVDAEMIRRSVRTQGSFNVIHLATMFKADVFIMRRDAWSLDEMKRARLEDLAGPDGPLTVRFASPEDTLLHKLVWYRAGEEVSDRQWSDILGVLKIQGRDLDDDYLDKWAPKLDVADLLDRARNA